MLRRLWPYTSGYRNWMLAGVLCSGGEAVLEMLLPLVMAAIVDVGIARQDVGYIVGRGGLMVVMAIGCMLLGAATAVLAAKSGQGFGASLRAAQYDHIQSFSFRNIERFSTASLITRMTNDVNAMQVTVTMGMRIAVRLPMMLISALILAISISSRLSRVFLVVGPVLILIVVLLIRKVGPMFREAQERTDDMNLVIQENLGAIRVVKSFVREGAEEEKFGRRNRAMRRTAERAYGLMTTGMPTMMLIIYSTIIAVAWLAAPMVSTGELEVGALTALFTYITQILMCLIQASMIMMMATRATACARRIVEVLDEEPDINNDRADLSAQVADGSVDFDHVSFRYAPEGQEWNLRDVDLHIASGMTVGILGQTGSGKSTLVQLIPRLYEATEGTVRVGGLPVETYSTLHLREVCSMVLQQNTLFSGSILDNLRWGCQEATEEEIRAACRAACADEFIEAMPDGYKTDLGQGGVNVSGGQKQRLCIARALLRKPKILILDDSTSAVDTATDAKIRQAFATQLPDTTKIIIAQRVSSVKDADMIVIMDDGRVVETGTHSQLLESSEIYRDLWQSQQEGVADNG